jgi:hypothetical protein
MSNESDGQPASNQRNTEKHRKKGKTIRISKHFKTFCETSGNRQCLEQLRCFSPDLAPIAVWSGR